MLPVFKLAILVYAEAEGVDEIDAYHRVELPLGEAIVNGPTFGRYPGKARKALMTDISLVMAQRFESPQGEG